MDQFANEPHTAPSDLESKKDFRDRSGLPQDAELVRLRQLLFSREIALLDDLLEKQSDKQFGAKKVSEVVAEAIVLRAGRDSQLNHALEPLVDSILEGSLRRRRQDFVNALFPLMGPAIRKSIGETFRSMLEGFSKSVEMAFSWRGVRWRFEAWRSGRPFSEIVLLNTLAYRVDQIFFIHSETGLVLSHAVNEGAGSQDADMVSAMLTAVQDFARDCFACDSEGELESLQMGEFTIFLEKSSKAYLACVVRGTPPGSFRVLLRETLEALLLEHDETLSYFSGDTEPFSSSLKYLDACLVTHYADEDKPLPIWAKGLPIILVAGVVGWLGYSYYIEAMRLKTMNHAMQILHGEPGLVITNVVRHKNKPWEVAAFKDSLAKSPQALLQAGGLDPSSLNVKTEPFISHETSIVEQRVANAIALPKGVTMSLDGNGVLSFKGEAPMSWILHVRDTARSLPGVTQVNLKELRDPMLDEMTSLVKEVENVSILFPLGKDVPVAEDLPKLAAAVDTLVEIEKLAEKMGLMMSLTIYGHADGIGLEKRNYEISQARAKTVAAMLYSKGSSIPISLYGMGSEYPKDGPNPEQPEKGQRGDQASRRIELRVHLSKAASADTHVLNY